MNRRILATCVEYWFRVVKPEDFFFRSPASTRLYHVALVGFDTPKQQRAADAWRKSILGTFLSCLLSCDNAKTGQRWEIPLNPIQIASSLSEFDQIYGKGRHLGHYRYVFESLKKQGEPLERKILEAVDKEWPYSPDERRKGIADFFALRDLAFRALDSSPAALAALLAPVIITLNPTQDEFLFLTESEDSILAPDSPRYKGHHCITWDELPRWPVPEPPYGQLQLENWLIAHPCLPPNDPEPTVQLARLLECALVVCVGDDGERHYRLIEL